MNRSGSTLGGLIHRLRRRNGWTLRQMSDEVGIPLSTLAKVEADKLSLTYDKLQQLSSRLGMTMAEFLALGLLAGTLAAVGAASIGYLVATRIFNLDYVPGVALWLGGLLAGAAVVGISGTLAVRSVVDHSPAATLRGA